MTEARRSVAILFGGLIAIGALWGLTTPLTKIAVSSGHGPFGLIVWTWAAPEWALAASGLLSVGAYAGYVWILRASGPVFAAQVSYLVTGFGVVWAMLVLGERYDAAFWIALAMIFAGLFLVQPRPVAPPVAVPVPPGPPLPPEAGP